MRLEEMLSFLLTFKLIHNKVKRSSNFSVIQVLQPTRMANIKKVLILCCQNNRVPSNNKISEERDTKERMALQISDF